MQLVAAFEKRERYDVTDRHSSVGTVGRGEKGFL